MLQGNRNPDGESEENIRKGNDESIFHIRTLCYRKAYQERAVRALL